MRSMHPNVIKPKRYADGTDPLTELWLRCSEGRLREVQEFSATIVPDEVKDLFDKFDLAEVIVELLPDGTEKILGDRNKVHLVGDHCGSTIVFRINGIHTPNKIRTYRAANSMHDVIPDITEFVVLLGDQHVAVKWADTKRKITHEGGHLAAYGANLMHNANTSILLPALTESNTMARQALAERHNLNRASREFSAIDFTNNLRGPTLYVDPSSGLCDSSAVVSSN